MSDQEKIEILRKALIGLIGTDKPEDLDQMEAFIRCQVIPDVDKMNTINAIDAIRRTNGQASV